MIKMKKLFAVAICCLLLGQVQLPVAECIYDITPAGKLGPKE